MAKGLDQYKERINMLNSFGKNLTKRSKSRCELCSASDVSLTIYEIEPAPSEPDIEKCIFLCETCLNQIKNPKKLNTKHFQCLNQTVWSDIPAVKMMSVKLVTKISENEAWAENLLEEIYLDQDEQEWVSSIKL